MKRLIPFLFLVSCGPDTPTVPPVVTTPIPVVTPTPMVLVPVVVSPTTPAFVLTGEPGSCIRVSYNGEASYALITTYWTTFENPNAPQEILTHTIKNGGSVGRCFGRVCIQGDADVPGSKEIGGVWFDRAGNPSSARVASTSCTTTPTPKPTPTPTPKPSPTPTPCPRWTSWTGCR